MRAATLLIFAVLFFTVAHCRKKKRKTADVLILGGGMAGVSAANRLSEHGIKNFIILESQSRLGGRLKTKEIAPGINVNVGANWIQGVDPAEPTLHPVYNLAEKCGGLSGQFTDYDDYVAYDSDGNELPDENFRWDDYETALEAITEYAEEAIAEGKPDMSLRDGLAKEDWVPVTPEDNFVEWYDLDFENGDIPEKMSLYSSVIVPTFSDFLADPEHETSDYYLTDNRGYPALIQCLASNFSSNPERDRRIHLNANVVRIKRYRDKVCAYAIERRRMQKYCGSYAIVTFSIEVLKKGAADSLFHPQLPSTKVDALSKISLGFYFIIYSEFDTKFWDDNAFIAHVSPKRGYFPVFQVVPQSRGVNAMAMHVTGDLAFRLAGLSDEALKAEVTSVYRGVYGDSVPEPNRIVNMPWGTDPSFLGSFSHVSPGGKAAFKELVKPEGRMHLAGEGTSEKYYGFVHGAYLSGIATADAVYQRM